jgi:hypothetical protein
VVLWQEEAEWRNRLVHQAPGGLASVAVGDVDPENPGQEIVLGGSTGQVWTLALLEDGNVAAHLVYTASSAIGDLAAWEFDPDTPGMEILVLTEDGKAVVLNTHTRDREGRCPANVIMSDTARLRNVAAGKCGPQGQPGAILVGASGNVTRLHPVGDHWRVTHIYKNPEPLARIAVGNVDPVHAVKELVLADDVGLITLLKLTGGDYIPEAIHREKKALRGVVSAELDATVPGDEIAVFGYGREVLLFTRKGLEFDRTVLLTEADRGHYLIAAQVFPESPTHELVAVGYSGKVNLIYKD